MVVALDVLPRVAFLTINSIAIVVVVTTDAFYCVFLLIEGEWRGQIAIRYRRNRGR